MLISRHNTALRWLVYTWVRWERKDSAALDTGGTTASTLRGPAMPASTDRVYSRAAATGKFPGHPGASDYQIDREFKWHLHPIGAILEPSLLCIRHSWLWDLVVSLPCISLETNKLFEGFVNPLSLQGARLEDEPAHEHYVRKYTRMKTWEMLSWIHDRTATYFPWLRDSPTWPCCTYHAARVDDLA